MRAFQEPPGWQYKVLALGKGSENHGHIVVIYNDIEVQRYPFHNSGTVTRLSAVQAAKRYIREAETA